MSEREPQLNLKTQETERQKQIEQTLDTAYQTTIDAQDPDKGPVIFSEFNTPEGIIVKIYEEKENTPLLDKFYKNPDADYEY